MSQARKELRAQTKDMKAKMAYLNNGSRIDDQVPGGLGALDSVLSGASGRTVP